MMVRGDPSYKTKVLQISTQYVDFRGCHAGKHSHLPNCTRFLVIDMSSIAVESSTNGQYGAMQR